MGYAKYAKAGKQTTVHCNKSSYSICVNLKETHADKNIPLAVQSKAVGTELLTFASLRKLLSTAVYSTELNVSTKYSM